MRSIPASDEDDDHELASDRESGPLHNTKPSSTCAPDVAAVAVPLGRAFEASRSAGQDVGPRCRIIIIQVPHPDLAKPVRRFLRLLLASDMTLIDGDDLDDRKHVTRTEESLVVFTEPTKPKSSANEDEEAVAIAMRLRCPIIGIATALGRSPKALIRLAEHRVVVPPIDATVVADVVEAVTATRPTNVDASMAARVTIKDLAIAVRDDVGAERSLERLQRLAEPQVTYDVPPLSELSGLGAAKIYCMEAADFMRAYLAGTYSLERSSAWSACQRSPRYRQDLTDAFAGPELPGVHFIADELRSVAVTQVGAPRRRHFRYPRHVFRGNSTSPKHHLHRRM